MVGQRHSSFRQNARSRTASNEARSKPDGNTNGHTNDNGDLERGPTRRHTGQRSNIFRFQDDDDHTAVTDQRREELKDKLLRGIDKFSLEQYRKSDEELKKMDNKAIRKFYEAQNGRLNDWLEVDALVMALADDVIDSMDPDHDGDGIHEHVGGLQRLHGRIHDFLPDAEQKKRKDGEKKAKWAINVNVLANIVLLVAKIIAAFYSDSLSLIASLVDSALDLLCTLIVWSTNRLVQWRLNGLNKRFPVGRRRLEPLGILVFSIIMVISFLQILQESVQKLLPSSGEKLAANLPPIAVGAMIGTIVLKGVIWIGCARIKTSQVQALAQDCKTDVYFNTLSLLFPFIGIKTGTWWLDPVGAALLSLFIIYDWAGTCFEQVTRLSGQAADDNLQKRLLFMAYRFSPIVEGFKCITAYHAGDGVWVEVDILLDENTTLARSHDIAETLQYCLEGLPEVDRAFVTTDYTSQGPSGHAEDAERF